MKCGILNLAFGETKLLPGKGRMSGEVLMAIPPGVWQRVIGKFFQKVTTQVLNSRYGGALTTTCSVLFDIIRIKWAVTS